MTVRGGLVIARLSTVAAHHRPERKLLTSDFTDHFIGAIGHKARIPERFAFFSDQNCIAHFQFQNGIQHGQSKHNIVGIGDRPCQRQLSRRSMAGLALNILDIFLICVNITISHGFISSMAIHAVEGVFAFCKLCDGLVIILQSVSRMIGSLNESHCPQIIVAAVVAGITLSVGHGG